MNYAEARARDDGSGWHFTVRNDDRIWPVADCVNHEPHATREEAEACFNAWRRDPAGVRLNAHQLGDWTGCVVCDKPTKSEATHQDIARSYGGVPFCEEHMTVENVLARIEDITQVIYS